MTIGRGRQSRRATTPAAREKRERDALGSFVVIVGSPRSPASAAHGAAGERGRVRLLPGFSLHRGSGGWEPDGARREDIQTKLLGDVADRMLCFHAVARLIERRCESDDG